MEPIEILEPITPQSQAIHFTGHACRAWYALLRATENQAIERPMYADMYSLIFGALIKLFPDEAVHAARARAITLTGVEMNPDITDDDTVIVMQMMVEELCPPRPRGDA